jgi:hypothetical protein
MAIDREFEHEHRALISVAEACWRPIEPSHSFHVFDWMAWKLRCRYPLVWKGDQIINLSGIGS